MSALIGVGWTAVLLLVLIIVVALLSAADDYKESEAQDE